MPRNRISCTVLLTLSLIGIPAQVRAAEEWRVSYKIGEERLRNGQIEQARRELALALAAAESSHANAEDIAVILDALGRTGFRAGKFQQAAALFEKALKLSTKRASRVPILCNAAQSYREAGDAAKSEKHLREALSLAPEEPHAWRLLGSVLIEQRKFSEAEAAERKALSLGDPSIAVAIWSDLAVIEEARGKHVESAKHLRTAIALAQPGYERARLLGNLGAAELKRGSPGEGLEHLRNSLEEMEATVGPQHPDVAGILEAYSKALLAARRKPEAQMAARRAKEIRSLLGATVDWRELK